MASKIYCCGGACSPHVPEVSRHYRVVVKAFASGQCGPGAEVGVTLTILQSGDPDVIFTNHAQCPSPSSRSSTMHKSPPPHSS